MHDVYIVFIVIFNLVIFLIFVSKSLQISNKLCIITLTQEKIYTYITNFARKSLASYSKVLKPEICSLF